MKLEMSSNEVFDYITQLQSERDQTTDLDIAYQNAAAVLYSFDPSDIHPFPIQNDGGSEWLNFFKCSDPVRNNAFGNYWQLHHTIRRQALKRLQDQGQLTAALAANPLRKMSEEQMLYENLLGGKALKVDDMSRATLVALSVILEWVRDILPASADLKTQITRAIPLADLLAPMHRLALEFVGRKNELRLLEEYAGIRTSGNSVTRFISQIFTDIDKNPPFLIYGPGGVGKSTLISKFILNNTESTISEPLPFAYLDIDRAVLDLEWPESFVIEAARQLSTQLPAEGERLRSVTDELERMRWNFDSHEFSKSYSASDFAVNNFGGIISGIKSPVLLVIDTFEEAQFLGGDIVDGIWGLFRKLQQQAPNLRIVVMGRTRVKEYPVRELVLTELSRSEGRELVASILSKMGVDPKSNDSLIDEVINVAGLNPMSLRLALSIVKEQGIDDLKKVETKNLFFLRLKEEVIQARLYGRILSHIHDKEVQKLAYPGLIVRRINPEIILSVLAGPCQLNITTIAQAKELFDKLGGEGALMTEEPGGDALIHRSDVRKLMLEDIKSKVPAQVVASLHDLAVKYYLGKDDRISRAEEIYHRLSRGEDPAKFEGRWMDGLESRLRNALEELPVNGRIWLSGKLGVTPDSKLLEKADLQKWEEITERSAQRFIASGNATMALQIMRERSARSQASPLYRLELEALRLLGLHQEALVVVKEALGSLAESANTEFAITLLLQAALTNEALSDIDEAITYISEAEKMLPDPVVDRIEALRVYVAHIRLLRKKGQPGDYERGLLTDKVVRLIIQDGGKMGKEEINELSEQKSRFYLDPVIANELRSNPALLQELVAEMGMVVYQLIPLALDYLGIDLRNEGQRTQLAKGFKEWNDQLSAISPSGVGELLERSGIQNNTIENWLGFIGRHTGRSLASAIYNWQYEIYSDRRKSSTGLAFDNVIVDISRANVDLAINKG